MHIILFKTNRNPYLHSANNSTVTLGKFRVFLLSYFSSVVSFVRGSNGLNYGFVRESMHVDNALISLSQNWLVF